MLNELKIILKLLNRKQKIICSLLIFVTILGSVLETAGILLITPIIQLMENQNSYTNKKYMLLVSSLFNLKSGKELLYFFLLVLIVFYVIKSFFLGLLSWYQNSFVYSLKYTLTNKLLSIYFHLPWPFYFSRNSALLMRNVNNNMILFSEILKSWITLFAEIFFVITVVSLLFVYQPGAMLIVLLSFGPLVWFFNRISNNLLKKSRTERYFNEGEKMKFLKQGLEGIKDIIINGNENFYLKKFKTHNYAEVNSTRQFMTLQQLPKLWLEALSVLGFAALLIIRVSLTTLF